MSAALPAISIVICAYSESRWAELAAAVRSIARQTVPARETIVVIDHNERLLRRAARHLGGARVIANLGAHGLSGARNAGTAAAQGAIVAFLDDDAVAMPDWLAQLTAAYRDPLVLAAGGRIRPLWSAGRPAWFPPEFDWVVGCSYRGLPERRQPVRNLIGCNMSFRRSALVAAGGFREGLGRRGADALGGEETELCIRLAAREPQGVILHLPAAEVHHRVPAERCRWRYFRRRCLAEGRSKAQIARLVGKRRGLASERRHLLTALPGGVLRGLGDGLLRGRPAGLGRAAAIVAGTALAAVGYLSARLLRHGADGRSPGPTLSATARQ